MEFSYSPEDVVRVPSGTKPQSAIATFANIVSEAPKLAHDSTPITHRVSSGLWSTGFYSLPTEIVRIIFQLVFESCVSSKGDDPAPWPDEDLLSPSLFPYALSCVCLRWFTILGTIPACWTRLVIAVDAIAASLDAARTTLKFAGNRPLKVVVTRHHGASETRDSERASVDRAMQLLCPYIDYIWSLSFDVEHSSSIPALWRERGHARCLRVLTFSSRFDTPSSEWLPAENSHEYKGRLKVLLLRQVTLNGHFLRHPLMAHPRLARWFRYVTSLTICGDAASGGNAISLYKFLSVIVLITSVRELTIEDVHFDDIIPFPNTFVLGVNVLCLRRVTSLRGILARTRSPWTDVTITDCNVHGFLDPDDDSPPPSLWFSSTNLTLASMRPSAPIEVLAEWWDGTRLSLIGCPRVSRAFLVHLYADTAPLGLSCLRIVDCADLDFSAGDVVALVRSREMQASLVSLMGGNGGPDGDDGGSGDWDDFAAMAEVCIEGRGPAISEERAMWLAEHLERFSWDTVGKDGLRYVWDDSVGRLTTSSVGANNGGS